jgi:hypothetical protein
MYVRFAHPEFNMKSDKYIFKKKLSLRRKSKRRLFIESAIMFILSLLLIYIKYVIPNKISLLQNLPTTFNKSLILSIELFSNLSQIFLVIFILISSFITLILLIGSIYRIFKIARRKTKVMTYK